MNELYEITDFAATANGATARVRLNAGHPIFSGHFPGQPVLPGVCMMELVNKLAEKKTGHTLRIIGGPQLKFLNMVNPRKTPELQVSITLEEKSGALHAAGTLFQESLVFLRFRLDLSAGPYSSAARQDIS